MDPVRRRLLSTQARVIMLSEGFFAPFSMQSTEPSVLNRHASLGYAGRAWLKKPQTLKSQQIIFFFMALDD
jgi:hypothetical protein